MPAMTSKIPPRDFWLGEEEVKLPFMGGKSSQHGSCKFYNLMKYFLFKWYRFDLYIYLDFNCKFNYRFQFPHDLGNILIEIARQHLIALEFRPRFNMNMMEDGGGIVSSTPPPSARRPTIFSFIQAQLVIAYKLVNWMSHSKLLEIIH